MKTKLPFYLALLISLLFSSCVSEEEPEAFALKPGDRCPEFTAAFSDGAVISTSSLRGMTSVIVFFSTTCPDCQKVLPEIQKVYEYALSVNRPIAVLCIARDEKEESIRRFWEENALTIPYSPQNDRAIYNLFASSVIPRIFIINLSLEITASWSDNPLPSAEEIINHL